MIKISDSILSRSSFGASKAYVDYQDALKVDKIEGKTLSSNDFTDIYKTKIENAVQNIKANGKIIPTDEDKSADVTPANIGAAPSVHSHSLSDIAEGILPVNYGGTGADNAQSARSNLDVYSKIEIDNKIRWSTSKNIIIYISSSGSDDFGDGTEINPYMTIKKAFDSIPPIINHSVIINIGQGTFALDTEIISGFEGVGELAMIGKQVEGEIKTVISNKLRFGYNTIRKIWIGYIIFEYINPQTVLDDIVDNTGIVELNNLIFRGSPSQILQSPLKLYNVPNAIIESCKFDYTDNAVTLIGTTRGFINNCTVNNSNFAVAVFNGAMAILRSLIQGNSPNVYKHENSGSSIVYPNGTFSIN